MRVIENQGVDAAGIERRLFLRRSLFVAGAVGAGAGAAMLAGATIPVLASSSDEVQRLQTAAAIENLAGALYAKLGELPATVSGASNPVIASVVENTIRQHAAAASGFNSALTAMGAKPQTGVDAALESAVVTSALAAAKTPYEVMSVALNLEDAATQTYVAFASDSDPHGHAFALFAALAPVAAQRVAVLRAFGGLLLLGAPQLIQLPAPIAQLPAIAGDVAFPDAMYPTKLARSATEGAVA